MSSIRVAFCCFLPDMGHVLPLVRMAAVVRELGWDFRFFVPGNIARFLQAEGYQVVDIGDVRPASFPAQYSRAPAAPWFFKAISPSKSFLREYSYPMQIAVYDRRTFLHKELRSYQPSLIIADDYLFTGLYVAIARNLGVEIVLHNAEGSFRRYQSLAKQVLGFRGRGRSIESGFRWISRGLDITRTLLLALGSPRILSTERGQESRLRNIWREVSADVSTPVLERRLATGLGLLEERYLRPRPDAAEGVHFIGALPPGHGQTLDGNLAEWLQASAGNDTVAVSFGSMLAPTDRQARSLFLGLLQSGVRVLWSSRSAPPGYEPSLARVKWVSFIPQPAVLAHKAVVAFVTHAGAGSVQDAVWAEAPLLCMPFNIEQAYNSRVVRDLGVGLYFGWRQCSPGRVVAAVRLLLPGTPIAQRVQAVGRELQALGGAKALVDVLSQALSSGSADQRGSPT